MENLIDIQLASATQFTEKGKRTKWIVNSYKGKPLYELPIHWSEKDTMAAIHFARKFELIAFNIWINFQRQKLEKSFDGERKALKEQIRLLEEANWRLAEQLGDFI